MNIIKRNGKEVEFDPKKIDNAITKAMKECGVEDRKEVEGIVAGVKATVEMAFEDGNVKPFTVEDIQDMIESELMVKYPKVAKAYILYRANQEKKREGWNLSDLGKRIYESKYRYNNESFSEFLDRTSGGNNEIRKLMRDKIFLFAGRILAGRGLQHYGKKITFSNCYGEPIVDDNLEHIAKVDYDIMRTFSYGGGEGVSIENLRPKGFKVNNSAEETTGSVSFMSKFNNSTEVIGQKGRRGALIIVHSMSHPDIYDFIKSKTSEGSIEKANISAKIPDAFMKAVEENDMWDLTFVCKDTGEEIHKEVHAENLYHLFCSANWDWAEPGALFWDRIQNWRLTSEDNELNIVVVNPCVTGDTLVQTVEGQIPIRDLVGKEIDVYCMDENNELTISRAYNIVKTRSNAKLVKITTTRGILRCTPDHPIYTKNRGYVEAKDIKTSDRIVGLNRKMSNEKYCSVALTGKSYVKEHRFIQGHYEDITNKDVHHKDENTLNNMRTNLETLSHSTHSKHSNNGHEDWNERDEKGQYISKEFKKKKEQLQLNENPVGVNLKIISVEHIEETEDVYDLTVDMYHNFIANGIVIHNCGEQPLPAYGACLLGSINLAELVTNPFSSEANVDFEKFIKAIHEGVKGLNEVLDENIPLHPLQEQRDMASNWRQIGLGIMGLADMFLQLGCQYGDKKSKSLSKMLSFIMINEAVRASAFLAKEHGSYPKFKLDKIEESPFFQMLMEDVKDTVREYGLRNSQLLTIAPTGSLSSMFGVSGGIEPIFMTSYERKTMSLGDEEEYFKIYTPIVEQAVNHGLKEEDVITAMNLNYKDRIDMQSIWQEHIDASISSTLNIPEHTSIDEVKEIYMYAWKKGLKGVTIYREGCKRGAILAKKFSKSEGKDIIQCPECGGEMVKSNGCETCLDCGYSPCSI